MAAQSASAALGGFAQPGLALGEGVLDGVEVGAVRWQQAQAGTGRLDQGLDLASFVCRQIVRDDDVAGSQFGTEHVLDISLEAGRSRAPSSTKDATMPRRLKPATSVVVFQ